MKKFLKKTVSDVKGFTLVEILVSVVILGILVAPFLSVFELSYKSNKSSNDISDATYIANQRMEYLYGLSVSDSDISATITQIKDLPDLTVLNGDTSPYKFQVKNGSYTEEFTIDTDTVKNRLDKVVVKVSRDGQTFAMVENLFEWN